MPSDVKNKRVLFLCPYPLGGAPGQRFRYEMYLEDLKSFNIDYVLKSFLDTKTNNILFSDKYFFSKVFGVLKGFLSRFLILFSISKFDFVYIFREASPIGPPVIEWIIAKVFRKKIIYDFDDAIFLPFKSERNKIINSIKWTKKVKSICKWSHIVSCGNKYLAKFANQHNDEVVVIPTVVDTEKAHNQIKRHTGTATNIGWTGSHSTNYLLELILPSIKRLQDKYRIKFIVISSVGPEFEDIDIDFIKWNLNSEIDDLSKIDIGVMPLFDDAWTQGKCGFKAIQYIAMGIPAVVSPVGVNNEIICHEKNGFLAHNLNEWEAYLEELITNADLRNQMGQQGREIAVSHYSKKATLQKFVNLFKLDNEIS